MQIAKCLFLVLIVAVVTGCAHAIVISPDIAKIERDGDSQVIPKHVGYYYLNDRDKEVATPGGGGDQVKYTPAKDIEAGLYKMLSNIFKSVSALKSDKDTAVSKNDISYIVAVDVSTNSSSPSLFTWPPTIFGVNLTCDITDETGKSIVSLLAVGEGRAEWDEFKSDFSLAGKRATEDALIKMQRLMLNAPALTRVSGRIDTPKSQAMQQSTSPSSQTKEDKLKELKRLYDAGLISDKVNLERQRVILGNP